MTKNEDDKDTFMLIAYRFASVVIFLMILIVVVAFVINTQCVNGGK